MLVDINAVVTSACSAMNGIKCHCGIIWIEEEELRYGVVESLNRVVCPTLREVNTICIQVYVRHGFSMDRLTYSQIRDGKAFS